ncbi:lysosomal alpha-glucosidase-like [Corticium candelabrum]|uniref:lysosomal alpha-glucosidase-like n=1 Tax=Corticium candelabrum TaxID=121492 RepID=UPI002E270FB1|nr:lysosomal alpha-glucosidase-like [Corticium candelabrum]
METETRLHVKIYDASHERYEVPIPTPIVKEKASSTHYHFVYTKYPFGFSVIRQSSGTVLFNSTVGGFIFSDQFIQMSALLSSSNVYGLGEHVAPLKLSLDWQLVPLFAVDSYGTPEGLNHNLYGTHPFYLNVEEDGQANGVLLLNSNAMEISLQPTPAITYRTLGGILDFYFFTGPTPDKVIQQYTEVVGRPHMPPYWALGFHLSRYGYNSLNATAAAVKRMIDADIPQDVQWNDIDAMHNHLDFTYDPKRFDGLPVFVDDLHKVGMRYLLIQDPGISNSQPAGSYPPYDDAVKMDVLIKNASGLPLVGKVWPGTTVFPDFFHPMAETYWEKNLKDFHDKVAFDGLLIDMNEISNFVNGSIHGCPNSTLEYPPYMPHIDGTHLYSRTICMTAKTNVSTQYNVHNLYGYSEAKVTMTALENVRKKRSIVISRSTFPGSGAHGSHWLGDNNSTWTDMSASISGILAMNMFGIPLVGADICGFHGNATVELCARWSALGAFYPLSFNHNTPSSVAQDPPSLGPAVVNASRTALLIRYSLLPTLYTLFHKAHVKGSTVVRPLFFEFPTDNNTWSIDTQFLWGRSLLITPVLQENASAVVGYFPRGRWFDFYTGDEVSLTSQNVSLKASIAHINLHVRGGHILVTQTPNRTTTATRVNPLGLVVALDVDGTANGSLFWDDGESLDTYEKGEYTLIEYKVEQTNLTCDIIKSGYNGTAALIIDRIHVFGLNDMTVQTVTVNGQKAVFLYNSSNGVLSVSPLKLPVDKVFVMKWMAT